MWLMVYRGWVFSLIYNQLFFIAIFSSADYLKTVQLYWYGFTVSWWNIPGWTVQGRSVPGCNFPATERSFGQSLPRTKYPLGTLPGWAPPGRAPSGWAPPGRAPLCAMHAFFCGSETFCPNNLYQVLFSGTDSPSLKMGTFYHKFAEDVLSKDCFVPRTGLSQGRFITKFLGQKIHRTFRSGTFYQGTWDYYSLIPSVSRYK
jgi:hypothetical protein